MDPDEIKMLSLPDPAGDLTIVVKPLLRPLGDEDLVMMLARQDNGELIQPVDTEIYSDSAIIIKVSQEDYSKYWQKQADEDSIWLTGTVDEQMTNERFIIKVDDVSLSAYLTQGHGWEIIPPLLTRAKRDSMMRRNNLKERTKFDDDRYPCVNLEEDLTEAKKGRVTDKRITMLKKLYEEFRVDNMAVLAIDTDNLDLGKVTRTPDHHQDDFSETSSMHTILEKEEFCTPISTRPKLVQTPLQSSRTKKTKNQDEELLEVEGASRYASRPKRINMENLNIKINSSTSFISSYLFEQDSKAENIMKQRMLMYCNSYIQSNPKVVAEAPQLVIDFLETERMYYTEGKLLRQKLKQAKPWSAIMNVITELNNIENQYNGIASDLKAILIAEDYDQEAEQIQNILIRSDFEQSIGNIEGRINILRN